MLKMRQPEPVQSTNRFDPCRN